MQSQGFWKYQIFIIFLNEGWDDSVVFGGFGWVRVGSGGFGWVRVGSGGFGWVRVGSGGFGWVRVGSGGSMFKYVRF